MDAIDQQDLSPSFSRTLSHSVAEIGNPGRPLLHTDAWKRIQRLEAGRVIQKRVALVDQDKLGLGVIGLRFDRNWRPLAAMSSTWFCRRGRSHAGGDGVLPDGSATSTTCCAVVVPDIQGYDTFYKRLIAAVPLQERDLRFAMEKIKNATTALPIP